MSVRFAGYAAVFDRPDGGGDIVRRGAFADALKRAGEVPLLLQHKAGRVLGRIEHLSEDKRGLRVIARVQDRAVGGANLAVLGDEVIQFGAAEPTGPKRFRLSRLLRGRRGSEWAMPAHQAGERFCLLTPASLIAIELPTEMVGASVQVRPNGLADDDHPGVSMTMSGEALRPSSPVNLKATLDEGGLTLSWTRRSRLGWAWVDGLDAPLSETVELYRVEISGTASELSFDTVEPRLVVGSDNLAVLGSGEATIEIKQVGDYALSRPLGITLTL